MKYLVKHWINVDMIAEEVIDGKDVDLKTNNIGKHEEPSENASYVVSDNIKKNAISFLSIDFKKLLLQIIQ